MLFRNTPGEKIHYIIDKFMNFRKDQLAKLESNPEFTLGDVTTVNLTMLEGGAQGTWNAFFVDLVMMAKLNWY